MKGITVMTLDDMIKGALGENHDDPRDRGMTDEQVVNRLREAHARLQEENTFTPGQIVRLKLGRHSTLRSADAPVIYVGELDKTVVGTDYVSEPSDLTHHHITQKADIIVAAWQGDTFVEFPTWSRDFEPHPDFQEES